MHIEINQNRNLASKIRCTGIGRGGTSKHWGKGGKGEVLRAIHFFLYINYKQLEKVDLKKLQNINANKYEN